MSQKLQKIGMRYKLNDVRYTTSIMLIFITALWLCSSAGAADRIVKMQEAAWTLDDAKKAILKLIGEPIIPLNIWGMQAYQIMRYFGVSHLMYLKLILSLDTYLWSSSNQIAIKDKMT